MTERLRELLHEAAPEPEPLQVKDIARRVRRRRWTRTGVASTVAAAVVAAIVVPLTASNHSGPRAEVVVGGPSTSTSGPINPGFTPPPTITVSGKVIPYVGPVPWSDAVIATADSTTITILADADNGLCGPPTERVEVHQDAETVRVLVAGYELPLPPGVACAAVAHGPQPLTVQLSAPLRDRHLVDAYDQVTHRVLVAATVPTLAGIPNGYEEQPIRWDESAREVERSWRTTGSLQALVPPSMITLTKAPAGTVEADGMPDGTLVASGVPVAGGLARVWSYTSSYNGNNGLEVTVRWTGADGSVYQLVASTWSGSTIGVSQAEALGRSVHLA